MNLIVEIAMPVAPDEMGADVFVTGVHGRLGFMRESTKKRLCNLVFKVSARIISDDLVANVSRESLIPDAERIQCHAVVEKFHFYRLVCRNPWSRVQGNGIPCGLDAHIWNPMVLQKLTHRICAIDLEAVALAAELFDQAQIVESRTNKQKFDVKFLPGLAPELLSPEKGAMRVVKQQGCAELTEQSRRFASKLSALRDPISSRFWAETSDAQRASYCDRATLLQSHGRHLLPWQ